MNPFKRHDNSNLDVFVPLENSQRQSSVIMTRNEKESSDIETPVNRANREAGVDVDVKNDFNPQSVDGLRTEIDLGAQKKATFNWKRKAE